MCSKGYVIYAKFRRQVPAPRTESEKTGMDRGSAQPRNSYHNTYTSFIQCFRQYYQPGSQIHINIMIIIYGARLHVQRHYTAFCAVDIIISPKYNNV